MRFRRRREKGQAPLEVIRPLRGRMPRPAETDTSSTKDGRGLPTGQALTEMVIALPILLLLMFGLQQFAQISIAKQKIYMAARYGARLRSTLPSATLAQRVQTTMIVQRAVQDYLKSLGKPPAEVSVSYYIGREGVTVTKEIPIKGYVKNIFRSPYKLTTFCYMENDPWEWGVPRGK